MDVAPGRRVPSGRAPEQERSVSGYLRVGGEDVVCVVGTVSGEQYMRFTKCAGDDPGQIHPLEPDSSQAEDLHV